MKESGGIMKITTMNKIAACGLDRLGAGYTVGDTLDGAAGVLVRSASLHETPLPDSLLAIARAGAGVNNIPVDACSEAGIVVFNTPGANANAVKELVLAGLFLSCRDIVGGIEWVKTLPAGGEGVAKQVEKGKSAFVGPELAGKRLGVIGLGAIGLPVAKAALALGMEVYGCKSSMTEEAKAALKATGIHPAIREEIYQNCDFISIHVPLKEETRGMINAASLAQMKRGVRLLNFSRAEIVNLADLKEALSAGQVAKYVVDFPTEEALGVPGIIAIPHLGASTPESEDNCAMMAADELKAYLEEGIIKNSVNFPDMTLPRAAAHRVCLLLRDGPALAGATALLSQNAHAVKTVSAVKKGYAYAVFDFADKPDEAALASLAALDGVVRVREI